MLKNLEKKILFPAELSLTLTGNLILGFILRRVASKINMLVLTLFGIIALEACTTFCKRVATNRKLSL